MEKEIIETYLGTAVVEKKVLENGVVECRVVELI